MYPFSKPRLSDDDHAALLKEMIEKFGVQAQYPLGLLDFLDEKLAQKDEEGMDRFNRMREAMCERDELAKLLGQEPKYPWAVPGPIPGSESGEQAPSP